MEQYHNSRQIANILSNRAGISITETTVRKIGMALKKHGFQRISKNKAYVFPVILKEYEEVDKENKQLEKPKTTTLEQGKYPSDLIIKDECKTALVFFFIHPFRVVSGVSDFLQNTFLFFTIKK